jgi:hypothetical protein
MELPQRRIPTARGAATPWNGREAATFSVARAGSQARTQGEGYTKQALKRRNRKAFRSGRQLRMLIVFVTGLLNSPAHTNQMGLLTLVFLES